MSRITNKHIIKIKELISDEVCMGTFGMVELELLEMEKDFLDQLQNTSSNSDCAKFPTIVAIVDNLNGGKNLGWTCGDVEPIVKAIKELGNFA